MNTVLHSAEQLATWEERQGEVGTVAYEYIAKKLGDGYAGKIVGMLIDQREETAMQFLSNYDEMMRKAEEAHEMLRRQGWKPGDDDERSSSVVAESRSNIAGQGSQLTQ